MASPHDNPGSDPREAARLRFLADELSALPRVQSILEVKAGDGELVSSLQARLWPHARLASVQVQASPPAGQTYAEALPEGPFDLAMLVDVLEHLDNDAALLSAVASRVRSSGHLLICVPASPRLYAARDERRGHRRRYTPRKGRDLVRHAGLALVRSGGLFHGLLPVRAAQVALERVWTPGADDTGWTGPEWAGKTLTSVLSAEGRVSRWAAEWNLTLPGLSWWALCRKP